MTLRVISPADYYFFFFCSPLLLHFPFRCLDFCFKGESDVSWWWRSDTLLSCIVRYFCRVFLFFISRFLWNDKRERERERFREVGKFCALRFWSMNFFSFSFFFSKNIEKEDRMRRGFFRDFLDFMDFFFYTSYDNFWSFLFLRRNNTLFDRGKRGDKLWEDTSTFTFCLEEKLHFDIFITRWSKEDKNKRHPVEFYAWNRWTL